MLAQPVHMPFHGLCCLLNWCCCRSTGSAAAQRDLNTRLIATAGDASAPEILLAELVILIATARAMAIAIWSVKRPGLLFFWRFQSGQHACGGD